MPFHKLHSLPALTLLAAPPLAAHLRVTVEPGAVLPGGSTCLVARLADSADPVPCHWTLLEPGAGELAPQADGSCRFTAAPGFLLTARTVRVRAASRQAPDLSGEAGIDLDPGTHRLVFERLLPLSGYLPHPDPLEPSLSFLAGGPGACGPDGGLVQQAPFKSIRRLAFAGDCPGTPVHRMWLLVDMARSGILLMDGGGRVQPWLGQLGPGLFQLDVGHRDGQGLEARFCHPYAIAVRPGARDGKDWEAVVADTHNHVLRRVDAWGNVTTVAGKPGHPGFRDGAAARSLFNLPVDLVLAPDGAIHVADHLNGAVRRIAHGQVTTLVGPADPDERRAAGDEPGRFQNPVGITRDPRTGHLHVLDSNQVFQVTAEGAVTRLAGAATSGFEPKCAAPSPARDPRRMSGIACLRTPVGVTCHGGRLYIADMGNHAIRVLDLHGGELTTLAGHLEMGTFRPGRLRAGRDLPSRSCAAVGDPFHVAFDDQGHALVSLGEDPDATHGTIAELSMAGLLEAPESHPEPPAPGTGGKGRTAGLGHPDPLSTILRLLGLPGDEPPPQAGPPGPAIPGSGLFSADRELPPEWGAPAGGPGHAVPVDPGPVLAGHEANPAGAGVGRSEAGRPDAGTAQDADLTS